MDDLIERKFKLFPNTVKQIAILLVLLEADNIDFVVSKAIGSLYNQIIDKKSLKLKRLNIHYQKM